MRRSIQYRFTLGHLLFLLFIFMSVSALIVPNNLPAATNQAIPYVSNSPRAPESSKGWQVAFVKKVALKADGVFCSGTALDSSWLLTAAHCFVEDCPAILREVELYSVAYGSTTIDKAKFEDIEKVVISPKWDCRTKANDLALVRLKKSHAFTPIQLASHEDSQSALKIGSAFQISGWGYTELRTTSNELKEGAITIKLANECRRLDNGALLEGMICAGDILRNACDGDSGGPLFKRSPAGVIKQFGIVSGGEGCVDGKPGGVYTEISPHKQWIESTMQSAGCLKSDIDARLC